MSIFLRQDLAAINSPARTLKDLAVGKEAVVADLLVSGPTRRRLLDLGLVPGAKIKAVRVSPAGDPTAYYIKGTQIALRRATARLVLVKKGGN